MATTADKAREVARAIDDGCIEWVPEQFLYDKAIPLIAAYGLQQRIEGRIEQLTAVAGYLPLPEYEARLSRLKAEREKVRK